MLTPSDPTRRTRLLQPHAASAIVAARVLTDQLDPGAIQGFNNPCQRLDDAANIADACLHPLDRRQRDARELSQRLLVDAEQGSRRSHLECRDHAPLRYTK